MWQPQEDDHEVSWTNKKSSNGEKEPHKDYAWNLETAKNFINKTKDSWPSGMKVAVVGSQWLDEAILMISWMPPRHAPMGNWANPIFLHQCRFKFGKELENVFNSYVRRIKDFERKTLPEKDPLI